ncbi:hypothetical protein Hanom_Chr06g00532861 [Helianthus anomalus]
MHISISLYIPRFSGHCGCNFVKAKSSISTTSPGGYCRSLHICTKTIQHT